MKRVLLCGPAGSGKTARVLTELRELATRHDRAGRFARFQVIVPTYSRAEHLKRHLLRGEGALPGIFDRGVGTFEQFAERETGLRLSALASGATCELLLRDALEELDAPVFRDVRRFAGFRRAALRLVKEIKSSEAEAGEGAVFAAAERLETAAASLPGERGRKLAALARTLEAYQRRLAHAGLLDHEDLLRALLLRLRERAPEGLELFALDGFSDLTQVQERIVQLVAGSAERSIVTLLLDRNEAATGPFSPAWRLRRQLTAGLHFEVETLTENRRAGGDLARLERLLAGEPVEPTAPDGSVRFLAGADPDDEADRVARTCLLWSAEGVQRNEMLIVLRSLRGGTAARVLEALTRHGVPARLMGRVPALGVPAVRGALRILRLVVGASVPTDALQALQGGAARGVLDGEGDRLREHARVAGVTDGAGLLALAREHALGTCAQWLEELARRSLDATERVPAHAATALLEAAQTLLALDLERDLAAADAVRAARDAAGLQRVRTLLGDLVAALGAAGRVRVAPQELVRLLEEALQDAWVTVRDRRVDVVNVVDAEEARQWEARAVVVAGLRLGEFPGAAREDVFVGDGDRREVARRVDVRLASRLEEAERRERVLFYTAATRASERLVLLAPAADDRGDPAIVSPFLEQALGILPEPLRRLDGANRSPGVVRPAEGETFHPADLTRAALAALTEPFAEGEESAVRAHAGLHVLRHLTDPATGDAPVRRLVRRVARWVRPPEASLREEGAARASLARPRPRSSSSLGDFAQCAYRHFARKGLGLSDAEAGAADGLDPLRAGTLIHAALEDAFRKGARDGAAARDAFEAAWRRYAGHLRHDLALERARTTMRETVELFVLREAAAPSAPGFAPGRFEVAFGMEGAAPLRLGPADAPVTVVGKIDRVDVDASGERAVVLDYKWSRSSRFTGLGGRIERCEDLQLPLYVLAAERVFGFDVEAAGFLALRDPFFKIHWLRLSETAPGSARAKGLTWTGELRSELLSTVEARVVALDASIRAGGIAAAPADDGRCGPARCPYADLCRYEGYGAS